MDKTSGKDRINEIIDTIIRVARGDYSAQIELSGINDDIDSLAMGINMMINDIENAIIKQKKTEAEIREINKQLQRIIDSSPAALMTVDIEGKITSWSPASEEIFGWSEDEVIGKFNPTVPKNMKTVFLKTIKGKQTNLELKCLNKNDSLVDILISTVPLLNEKGKFIGALGVMTDITRRKKAEGALKESEEKFRTFVDTASDLMGITDKDGNFTDVNESMTGVLGYSKDEMIGMHITQILTKKSLEKDFKPNWEKFVTEGKISIETTFATKEGKEIYGELKAVAIFDSDGKFAGSRAVVYNLTKRKKTMDEIEKTKHDLKVKNQELENTIRYANRISLETKSALTELDQIFNSTADGMLVIDKYFHILKMNDTLSTMFGISKAEVMGRKCYEVLNGSSCRSKLCPIKCMMDGVERVEFETGIEHNNGTKIPCTISATIYKGADGEIIGFIENIKDITKWKKAEEKIKQQNIELEKLNQLKSMFLNITSHELRTPMSSIKGYIQMLLRRTLGEISDEQKSAMEVILRNINRLDHLIQDILDISRIESGTMKFIPEKTNLQEMLNEIAETMKSSAGLKEIKLNTDIAKGLPDLFIDQERIKQVIINLLNNAIKFSPDGSAINIRAKKEKNDILFEVQDFGRGIPQDKQEKIFDTFYQVDSDKDTKFGGAGLGLAISRGIAIAHGGKIWVESKGIPGEGSTFRFILPVKSVKDIESRFKKVDVFRLGNKEE
jgi:PAS domain S-box-containing protein